LKLNQKLEKNKATWAETLVAHMHSNHAACSRSAWPTALPGWRCMRPNGHSRARLASARVAARSGGQSARGFYTAWTRRLDGCRPAQPMGAGRWPTLAMTVGPHASAEFAFKINPEIWFLSRKIDRNRIKTREILWRKEIKFETLFIIDTTSNSLRILNY
jgi:hypothetical protein